MCLSNPSKPWAVLPEYQDLWLLVLLQLMKDLSWKVKFNLFKMLSKDYLFKGIQLASIHPSIRLWKIHNNRLYFWIHDVVPGTSLQLNPLLWWVFIFLLSISTNVIVFIFCRIYLEPSFITNRTFYLLVHVVPINLFL